MYEYLNLKWGYKYEAIATDTDVIMLHILKEDIYWDIKDDIYECFDTSNFIDGNRFLINAKNNMDLYCFKIETGENIVTAFVGLRAKMYWYTIKHENNHWTEKWTGKWTERWTKRV